MSLTQTEKVLGGDHAQAVIAMVVARCWRDPEYRTRLLLEPKAVLSDEGLEFPVTTEIVVVADGPETTYVALPAETTADDALTVLHRRIPVPAGRELRLVQNTEDRHHLVLPLVPEGVDPTTMTEYELISTVPRVDNGIYVYTIEAATVGSSVNIFAEAVAVVVVT